MSAAIHSTGNADIRSVREALDEGLNTALHVARLLERGQAQTPLQDHLESLPTKWTAQGLTIAIVALDDESARLTCGWLAGTDERFRQFPCVLQLPRDSTIRLLAGIGDSELAHTECASRMLLESDVLMLAGSNCAQLPKSSDAFVREMAETVSVVWPIVIGVSDQSSWHEPEWLSGLAGLRLPSLVMFPDEPHPPFPVALLDGAGVIRRLLEMRRNLRLWEGGLQLTEDLLSQEQQQLQVRGAALDRRADVRRNSDRDRVFRTAIEQMRRAMEDRLSQLELTSAEMTRNRLLPKSAEMGLIERECNGITAADVQEELEGRSVRMSLSSEPLQRLQRLLGELVRSHVRAGDDLFRSEIQVICDQTSKSLCETIGSPRQVSLTRPDADALFDSLHQALILEPRYEADLPKKGWMDRLSYGRRPVFALTMIVSLFGAAIGVSSSGLTKLIAPVALVLFLGGVIFSFRSFAAERQERLHQELKRLRQILESELRRIFETALREWTAPPLECFVTRAVNSPGRLRIGAGTTRWSAPSVIRRTGSSCSRSGRPWMIVSPNCGACSSNVRDYVTARATSARISSAPS